MVIEGDYFEELRPLKAEELRKVLKLIADLKGCTMDHCIELIQKELEVDEHEAKAIINTLELMGYISIGYSRSGIKNCRPTLRARREVYPLWELIVRAFKQIFG